MEVTDDVSCNHDLFSDHKGEMHQTQSLGPIFPGSTYEITPAGRLELLQLAQSDRCGLRRDSRGSLTRLHLSLLERGAI